MTKQDDRFERWLVIGLVAIVVFMICVCVSRADGHPMTGTNIQDDIWVTEWDDRGFYYITLRADIRERVERSRTRNTETTEVKPWHLYTEITNGLYVKPELTFQERYPYATNTVVPSDADKKRAMKKHLEENPNCYVCNAPYSLLKTAAKIGWRVITNEVKDGALYISAGTYHEPYIIKGKNKKNPVHHDLSVHAFPQFKAAWWNLYTLCYRHHGHIGHGIKNGGSWTHSNKNLKRDLDALRAIYKRAVFEIDPTVDITGH